MNFFSITLQKGAVTCINFDINLSTLQAASLTPVFKSRTVYRERQSKDVSGFVNGVEYSLEESLMVKDKLYEEL